MDLKHKILSFLILFLLYGICACKESEQSRSEHNSETLSKLESNTLIDSRDNQSYRIVKIGKQIWMVENLRYKSNESWCSSSAKCEIHGRLYTWKAAMKACPDGWTIPDNSDWETLKRFAESKIGMGKAGRALKANVKSMYPNSLTSTDELGFSAMLAGDKVGDKYTFVEETGYYWSADEEDATHAYDWIFSDKSDDLINGNIAFSYKKNGFSVRCIKKENSQIAYNTFVDNRDGNTYRMIKIGNQSWMAENLKYKTQNSRCNKKDDSKCSKYGRLYGENEGLCPIGWHLPTYEEVAALFDAVGGVFVYASDFDDWEGGGYTIWDAYTSEKLRLNGFIDNLGATFHMGDNHRWSCDDDCSITTSNAFEDDAYVRCVKNDLNNYQSKKNYVKDVYGNHSTTSVISSSSPNSVSAKDVIVDSFTDSRDGHIYKSVKIGTQTWMAENLKYKGGYYSWSDAVGFSANLCGTHHVCGLSGTVKGVCPKGWHLPSKYDFETLIAAVGGMTKAAYALMSDSIDWCTHCNDYSRFTNDYGFSAVPNGYINYFGQEKNDGRSYFWSSTEADGNTAYDMYMGIYNVNDNYDYCNLPPVIGVTGTVKYNRYSVRCLKD